MRATLIKLLLRLFAGLPLRMAHAVGAIIGTWFVFMPNKLRSITRTNIALCFATMGEQERTRLLHRSLIETGKTMTEIGALWLWPRDRMLALVSRVSGEHLVKEALTQGKGVILVAPHLGSWETVGLYCSAHYPITSLYRPPRMSALDSMMRAARQRLGATLVPTDAGGIRALYRALEKGEVVGILPDQEPSAGTGVFAPLFGVPAYTMVLVARLALKTKAPVIFAYAERLPLSSGYHLHFLRAPPALHEGSVEDSTRAMNAMVEECVRALPDQYQWSYKRFRSRPAGEKRFY